MCGGKEAKKRGTSGKKRRKLQRQEQICKQEATLSQGGLQPQGWAVQYVSNDSFLCYKDLSEYFCF